MSMPTPFFPTLAHSDAAPREIRVFRVQSPADGHFTGYRQTPRPDYALTFVHSGTYTYESPAGSFDCTAGTLSFLPKDSTYVHRNTAPAQMTVAYFALDPPIPADAIARIAPSDPPCFARLFDRLAERFFAPARAELAVKAALCELLAAVAQTCAPPALSAHAAAMLTPAFDLLADPSVFPTVAALAQRCALSETAFRDLFRRCTGKPPKRFIDERKVEQVESLRAAHDLTITDAARACGFRDPAYFFKLYKRLYGRAPGKAH